jgi:hypothetical protein
MSAVSIVISAVIYCAFAAAVFVVHGSTPDISVDHITYLKQANGIMEANPDGFYARNLTSITSYAALLAYLHGWTGSHILSLNSLQKKGVSTGARAWREAVEDVHRAFRLADMREVERIGRKYKATLAVEPWSVEGAPYRDRHFSIIRIPATPARVS